VAPSRSDAPMQPPRKRVRATAITALRIISLVSFAREVLIDTLPPRRRFRRLSGPRSIYVPDPNPEEVTEKARRNEDACPRCRAASVTPRRPSATFPASVLSFSSVRLRTPRDAGVRCGSHTRHSKGETCPSHRRLRRSQRRRRIRIRHPRRRRPTRIHDLTGCARTAEHPLS
jgi:hypothetical protein